jgi:hypothetical protein
MYFFDQIPVLIAFSSSGKFFLDLLTNLANHGPVRFQEFHFRSQGEAFLEGPESLERGKRIELIQALAQVYLELDTFVSRAAFPPDHTIPHQHIHYPRHRT